MKIKGLQSFYIFLCIPLYRGDNIYKINGIKFFIIKYGENKMPPSGFSQKAINGLLIFVESCYEDLLKEIKEGKKTEGQAIKEELENIKGYLTDFKI
jgi:hypothetical protein